MALNLSIDVAEKEEFPDQVHKTNARHIHNTYQTLTVYIITSIKKILEADLIINHN